MQASLRIRRSLCSEQAAALDTRDQSASPALGKKRGYAMLTCAAGDIHGAMNRLYHVFAFEASLGVRFDYVLHVGDFGIWPDPRRIDKVTRHHDGVGDFPAWLRENRGAPRPTLLIKGNHEDFVWLDAHQDAEVLPALAALRNGSTVDIQARGVGGIRVGGAGGCYRAWD